MSKLVHISEAASLAMHSMVLIAQSGGSINANQIARLTGASRNHLAKVLQRLVKQDMLKSGRGPSGGFILKKKPKDITLLEIYEMFDGVLEKTDCPQNHNICPFEECLVGDLVNKVTDDFKKYFNSKTLKDFL